MGNYEAVYKEARQEHYLPDEIKQELNEFRDCELYRGEKLNEDQIIEFIYDLCCYFPIWGFCL